MNNVKREKKNEVAKPTKDTSCTSSDSSSSDCTSSHSDHHERKYDEHCDVKRREGKTHCKRKCRTVCVVECEKEVNFKYEWCYKTKEEKPWRSIESQPVPKKCDEHHDKPRDEKK
jgi:hypothetical protein